MVKFEYLIAFEFKTSSKNFIAKSYSRKRLKNIVRRRKLRKIQNEFVKSDVIQFFKLKLLERARVDEVQLIDSIMKNNPENLEVYSNSRTLLLAIRLFEEDDGS